MSGLPSATQRKLFEGLARPGGAFAMVALDQRGSLENMLRASGRPVDQAEIDQFRSSTVEALTPLASAILLEKGFLSRTQPSGRWTGSCGLIVAADELVQPPDLPVEDSQIDPAGATLAVELGAQALKLLVLWFAGEANEAQGALVDDFVRLAHDHGMLALVEGLVRPARHGGAGAPSGRDLIAAAERFSVGADIYKGQVPTQDGDSPEAVEQLSRELTSRLECPWVVLSTGIPAERFPSLVGAACRGGASGFLAGRAIWSHSLTSADPSADLKGPAASGLLELVAIVDAEARPWWEGLPA